ncbi:MAG: 2-amino-4-hydroxy-6-hydroxymethyldihydropteridine diphosphokinase [Chromatiaceae bacterium]|nr:2-amino-4-hydroxy-6-hydroxymethyldihydropteridine diphosphokinase [Chromatiaceae bacterium]
MLRRTPEVLACLALGSNIEPVARLRAALAALKRLPESRLLKVSRWYRTRPWGIEDQPEFINLAVTLATRLEPLALLAETQAIERALGRTRGQRNGPRTIDLDILLHGEQTLDMPELRLPHPALTWRDFMLIPLIEIAPDVVHPERGRPLAELVDEIRYRQIIAPLSGADAQEAGCEPGVEGVSG